jgi:hypothetical protein
MTCGAQPSALPMTKLYKRHESRRERAARFKPLGLSSLPEEPLS